MPVLSGPAEQSSQSQVRGPPGGDRQSQRHHFQSLQVGVRNDERGDHGQGRGAAAETGPNQAPGVQGCCGQVHQLPAEADGSAAPERELVPRGPAKGRQKCPPADSAAPGRPRRGQVPAARGRTASWHHSLPVHSAHSRSLVCQLKGSKFAALKLLLIYLQVRICGG